MCAFCVQLVLRAPSPFSALFATNVVAQRAVSNVVNLFSVSWGSLPKSVTGSVDDVRTSVTMCLDSVAYASTGLRTMRNLYRARVLASFVLAPPPLRLSRHVPFAGRSWAGAFRLLAFVVVLITILRRRAPDVRSAKNDLCGRNVGPACLAHLWALVGVKDLLSWRKHQHICSAALPPVCRKRRLLQ